MIKGLGREKGWQTAIATVITLVNLVIVFQAVSTLGEQDAAGQFRFTAEVFPPAYFGWLAVSLAFGGLSMWLIRYPEPQSRWGARVFASLLLPGLLLLFTLNARLFSWDAFLAAVF